MTSHLDATDLDNARSILSVTEFARRFRIEQDEEMRLMKLLGPFATQHELLMNARRPQSLR